MLSLGPGNAAWRGFWVGKGLPSTVPLKRLKLPPKSQGKTFMHVYARIVHGPCLHVHPCTHPSKEACTQANENASKRATDTGRARMRTS